VRCVNVINARRLLLVGLDSGEIQWWRQACDADASWGPGALPTVAEPTAGGAHFANLEQGVEIGSRAL